MSTIDRLKEIDSILRAESWYSEKYHAIPQTWVDLGKALPKLLAVIEAAKAEVQIARENPSGYHLTILEEAIAVLDEVPG